MQKILVVNDIADCGESYGRPFREWATVTNDVNVVEKNPETILAAVFTGGSDVDPSYYNHRRHQSTYCNTDRDEQERAVFKKLAQYKIPLFGICRGAQFLCAMSGGTLVQHLDGHSGRHGMSILDEGGKIIEINSTHHQMQVPPESAVVIGVAEPRRSSRYLYDKDGSFEKFKPDYEYEVVYYPTINALGVQYHPETMMKSTDGWKYYQRLIERHLKGRMVNS